ncbi:LysM domain-containing protein [Ophiocordyceps sinensis CO18]|uniref:LysM domain-containing protein n=1 Tax=Ophiocordyceps sinensis (strain Co18 / CGMCC 3.14243) TaxID=911162 RepID=T5AJ02_OPHSC|nr:LysM domain-containing protein [Ophiocordyceps sinensis CO18]
MVGLSALAFLAVVASSLMTHTAGHSTRAAARIYYGSDVWLALINATPYRWKRGYRHSYQVKTWNEWPEYMVPGQSFEMLARLDNDFGWHSAGEVQYHLEGTATPMGLQVEFRSGRGHPVHVRFLDTLETMNNARGSVHELGNMGVPGGVGFLLAGSEEGGFVSNDGPQPWMRDSLPDLGNLTLRELAMPRTHHSGMWKGVAPIGVGRPRNTLAQADDLWNQLGNGGIRVLDVRATYIWHEFRASHVTDTGFFGWQGMIGAGIEEMIDVINDFNDDFPGELIIFDVHETALRRSGLRFKELGEDRTLKLYELFKKLKHRLPVPDNEDLTTWPLERFIGNRSSAVLVRFHPDWLERAPDDFPGGAEGFVTSNQMPYLGRWSDTNLDEKMTRDQLSQMANIRQKRSDMAFNAQWILTQSTRQAVIASPSIIRLNAVTWRRLYHDLWNPLTDQSYPNWITVDGSHHNQLKALAMAINLCFGARKCGSLGGKVQGSTVRDRYHAVEVAYT